MVLKDGDFGTSGIDRLSNFHIAICHAFLFSSFGCFILILMMASPRE